MYKNAHFQILFIFQNIYFEINLTSRMQIEVCIHTKTPTHWHTIIIFKEVEGP